MHHLWLNSSCGNIGRHTCTCICMRMHVHVHVHVNSLVHVSLKLYHYFLSLRAVGFCMFLVVPFLSFPSIFPFIYSQTVHENCRNPFVHIRENCCDFSPRLNRPKINCVSIHLFPPNVGNGNIVLSILVSLLGLNWP